MSSLSPYKQNLKNKLIENFTNYFNEDEKISVGSIIPSLVPLDEKYFLLCDGRILNSVDEKYKELYAAIGDTYANFATRKLNQGEFCIPNYSGKLVRMTDTVGSIDDKNRELGDEKEWGMPEDKKTDFELFNQDKFIKNSQFKTESDNDGKDTTPLHIVGSAAHSNFKSTNYNFVENGSGKPRVGDSIKFKRFKIYAYIKYKPFTI